MTFTNPNPSTLTTVSAAHEFLSDRAPAALANEPFGDLGEKQSYQFLPTTRIVEAAYDSGYRLVTAQQQSVKANTQTFDDASAVHVLRFRPEVQEIGPGETFAEIVFRNGHAANASAKLFAGLFRLACSNGMIVPVEGANPAAWSHRHTSGLNADDVIKAFDTCSSTAQRSFDTMTAWQGLQLETGEAEGRNALKRIVKAGAEARWGSWDDVPQSELRCARDFAHIHRREDTGRDLWTTFNRIQETLIRGRKAHRSAGGDREKVRAIRPCANLDVQNAVNARIWTAAEEVAEHLLG